MQPKYRYILLSNDTGERLELRDAPQGWDATKYRLVRDLTYFGILKSISVEFEFVGDGFDFMQKQRLLYGVDADVIMRVYKINPNEFLYEGKINQENYVEDRKFSKYKVDIIQSSFVQSFQNRNDVELNILNTLSLDRHPVTPAGARTALVRGKTIQFYSEFEGNALALPPDHEEDEEEDPNVYHHTIPWKMMKNGSENVQDGTYFFSTESWNPPGALPDNPLIRPEHGVYINNYPEDQFPKINWRIGTTLTYKGVTFANAGPFADGVFTKLRIVLANAEPDDDDNFSVAEELYSKKLVVNATVPNSVQNFEYSGTLNPTVAPGQFIVFLMERWHINSASHIDNVNNLVRMEGAGITDLNYRTEQAYNALELTIYDDSVISDTSHPVILPHELFTNLIAQMNGGEFYSEFFGREELGYNADGVGAYLAITKGELLRGIPLDEVQIATSFRDAFASYNSVFCLGAVITQGRIRVEPLDFLFNAEVVAHIGEVNELQLSPTKEFLFNSVKTGYPKNEYEEENGRDEFNTEYQYTNSLRAVKKELNTVSKFYGDGYGIEFARRESVRITGTKDSKYDDKIFFIDLLQDEDGNLMTRRLEGILYVSGIFSPETAINLRIAVGQNQLRWKKYLNIPLSKKEKVYYFQSKDKNAGLQLVTELGTTIDGQDINTGVNSYFIPEQRSFNCPVTLELLYAILQNPLGIVSYTYDGEKFFDHVYEIDAETDKGKAEWRMLGTKDTPIEVNDEIESGNYLKYGDGLTDFVKYGNGEKDFILYQ